MTLLMTMTMTMTVMMLLLRCVMLGRRVASRRLHGRARHNRRTLLSLLFTSHHQAAAAAAVSYQIGGEDDPLSARLRLSRCVHVTCCELFCFERRDTTRASMLCSFKWSVVRNLTSPTFPKIRKSRAPCLDFSREHSRARQMRTREKITSSGVRAV